MKKDLKDLLIDELHDILSSEEQIVKALPGMVTASESPELKKAFASHLKETKGQVQRLQKIFKLLKVQRKEKFCKATKGLIDECKEVLKDFKTKSSLRDAALISKAQRIEHYEIAAYGTVRTFANELDLDDVADLLQATLNEEGHADKTLTKIAEGGLLRSGVNYQAITPLSNKPKALKKPISKQKVLKKPASKPKALKKPASKAKVVKKSTKKPVSRTKKTKVTATKRKSGTKK